MHPMPWLPDLLFSLFCLAFYVSITRKEPVKKVEPVAVPVKKSIYPIPRGRMS